MIYEKYLNFDEIEKAISGRWLAEKYNNFTEEFIKEIADEKEVYIKPDIAVILLMNNLFEISDYVEAVDNKSMFIGTVNNTSVYLY